MTLQFSVRIASFLAFLTLSLAVAACGDDKPSQSDDELDTVTAIPQPTPQDTSSEQDASIRQVSPIDSSIAFEVKIGDTIPPYVLRFRPDWTARKFDTIIVSRQGSEVQRLTNFDMEEGTVAQTDDPASYFSARDLNFDGRLDLQLMVGGSSTSHSYCYWLFNPRTGQFVVDATLKQEKGAPWINEKEKTVMFHTNQGCGGRCYTRNTYQFSDSTGHFTLIRQETQIATGVKQVRNDRKKGKDEKDGRVYYDDNPNSRYVRTIKGMKDGKFQVLSKKVLSGGEAM